MIAFIIKLRYQLIFDKDISQYVDQITWFINFSKSKKHTKKKKKPKNRNRGKINDRY